MQKKINVRIIIIVVVSLFLFAGLIELIKTSSTYSITKIIINNHLLEKPTMDGILAQCESNSIFRIDLEKLERILQKSYFADKVTIRKVYPNTLKIKIVGKLYICYLIFKKENKSLIYAIDSENNIIMKDNMMDEHDIPRVYYDKPVGSKTLNKKDLEWQKHSTLISVLETLNYLNRNTVPFFSKIEEIRINSEKDNGELKLKDSSLKVVFGEKLSLRQLVKLDVILPQITKTKIKELDLRFDRLIGKRN